MYFELAEESVNNLKLDTKVSISQEILSYFASLTYGALRGMCLLKNE